LLPSLLVGLFSLSVLSEATYRPAIKVELTIRHDNFSGGFFETGVKKLATALSTAMLRSYHIYPQK
jgi:hypothetical protein